MITQRGAEATPGSVSRGGGGSSATLPGGRPALADPQYEHGQRGQESEGDNRCASDTEEHDGAEPPVKLGTGAGQEDQG